MATKEKPKKLNSKQVALAISEELDEAISAKQLRYWLRSQDAGVGRGKRYEFTAKEAEKIAAKFIEDYEARSDEE